MAGRCYHISVELTKANEKYRGMGMQRAKAEYTLNQLKNGQEGTVERIELTGPTKRRLIEMGITPGTNILVRKRAPLGDPIEIMLRGYTLTLRKEDAVKIFLKGEVKA